MSRQGPRPRKKRPETNVYPDFSLPLQGKVWVPCNLGTPSIKLSYSYIASLCTHTNSSVRSFRKVYPSVPKKRLFVEIKPKNLGTRGYKFGQRPKVSRETPGKRVSSSRFETPCALRLKIQPRGGISLGPLGVTQGEGRGYRPHPLPGSRRGLTPPGVKWLSLPAISARCAG